MENTARLEPGFVASQFGIDACPNKKGFTDYLDERQALGINACAYCNGCRISYNPETGSAQANCSATVRTEKYVSEGQILTREVPGLQLTFPVEVPSQLPQENALIVEFQQDDVNEQAA